MITGRVGLLAASLGGLLMLVGELVRYATEGAVRPATLAVAVTLLGVRSILAVQLDIALSQDVSTATRIIKTIYGVCAGAGSSRYHDHTKDSR